MSDWPAIIAAFLKDCRRRNLAANSLRAYEGKLNSLVSHLDRESPKPSTPAAQRQSLKDWLHNSTHWEDGEPKSASTQAAYRATLSALIQFAIREDFIEHSPLKPGDLKRPRIPDRKRYPSEHETRQLLEAAPKAWALMYRALRLTGARPSELTGAMITDIDEVDGKRVLTIEQHKTRHQTSQDRIIPLGDHVWPIVEQAMKRRQFGPIFLNTRGQPWTVSQLSRIFRQLRDDLGLSSEYVLYCTRHEFGSKVAKKHGINEARILLNHSSIRTTQKYAHLTESEMSEIQSESVTDV